MALREMYYCYSGFRSYLIKILAKKNIENDLHSCVVLCHCQCVYCAQCTANKITTSRTLDRLNGMRFVRYFFYSIALGTYIYTMPQTVGIFYVRIFILYFSLKTCLEICFEVILFSETLCNRW